MASSRYEGPGLRYVRVADSLRRKVIEGEYQLGERLPRQHDLADQYGVSFTTLKQALDILERDGYIIRKAGQGTYAAVPEDDKRVALVVDDDVGTCVYLSRALARNGCETSTVRSGEGALVKLKEQRFDLIFLDLIMPDLSGPEIFQKVREIDPDVLVVIITAYPDSTLMEQALEVGPFAVMKKPFTVSEVQALLSGVRLGSGITKKRDRQVGREVRVN